MIRLGTAASKPATSSMPPSSGPGMLNPVAVVPTTNQIRRIPVRSRHDGTDAGQHPQSHEGIPVGAD